MDLKEIDLSGIDPNSHWYYRTKRIPVLQALKDVLSRTQTALNIVDIGSGSGFFSDCLIRFGGRRIFNVDLVDTGYPDAQSVPDERIQGCVTRRRELPSRIVNSLVLMMDVLEHVKDDAGLLRRVTERCEGKNRFFITAPAFMSLWSSHDVFLGHHRRYTLPQLTALAHDCGLRVTANYYLYGAILPAVWLTRRRKGAAGGAGDLGPMNKTLASILELICRFEFIFRKLNKFAGVTCVIEGIFEQNRK
ncbi:MAG: methyltransferase domain-containing protein [Elusimicrobiota bacterium]